MRTKCKVGGRHFSLNGIETNEIRKRFQEPRIHFAIACASRGCPWLSRETFTAEHLEEQLEARARLFLNQTRNVRVNSAQREVSLVTNLPVVSAELRCFAGSGAYLD